MINLSLIARQQELRRVYVKLGFQACGVGGCRKRFCFGLFLRFAFSLVGLADGVKQLIRQFLSEWTQRRGEVDRARNVTTCRSRNLPSAFSGPSKGPSASFPMAASPLPARFTAPCTPFLASFTAPETSLPALRSRPPRNCSEAGDMGTPVGITSFEMRSISVSVSALGFESFESLEKAVQHGFGLRGERFEVVIEQTFGGKVASLAVSIFAGELIRVRFQCFVRELFERFAKQSVFQLRSDFAEFRDFGRGSFDSPASVDSPGRKGVVNSQFPASISPRVDSCRGSSCSPTRGSTNGVSAKDCSPYTSVSSEYPFCTVCGMCHLFILLPGANSRAARKSRRRSIETGSLLRLSETESPGAALLLQTHDATPLRDCLCASAQT